MSGASLSWLAWKTCNCFYSTDSTFRWSIQTFPFFKRFLNKNWSCPSLIIIFKGDYFFLLFLYKIFDCLSIRTSSLPLKNIDFSALGKNLFAFVAYSNVYSVQRADLSQYHTNCRRIFRPSQTGILFTQIVEVKKSLIIFAKQLHHRCLIVS